MLTETQCRREDVRVGDEILVPRSAWRTVQAIAAIEEIVWVTFIDGSRHGFASDVLVTVRRARAPAAAPAAQPLDFNERCELIGLRQCELHVPATFASEREELDALRAELQRELAKVRALTEDQPLAYSLDPVSELSSRRTLAEQRRKADEAAREEKARKEREAEQARLTYERQQRDDERDRAQRFAAAHTTLTAAERQEEDALRKNWEEHDLPCEENGTEPIYSAVGDCGREHLSPLAACACANVRLEAARALERVYAPTQPRPAPRTPLAVAAAARPAPSPPTRSAAARPTTLHLVSEPRPHPVPAPLKRVPSPPLETGSGAVPAAREPVPARPSAPAPPSRRALILDAVRSSATPLSANAIATTVGGRKAAVLEEVRALVREGVLVLTEAGLIPRSE